MQWGGSGRRSWAGMARHIHRLNLLHPCDEIGVGHSIRARFHSLGIDQAERLALVGVAGGIIVVVGGPGAELDCSNEVDARIVEKAHKSVTLSMVSTRPPVSPWRRLLARPPLGSAPQRRRIFL